MQKMPLNLDNLSSPATVAVVGLGKIGLPLAVQYALHGWRVIGCDVNPSIVEVINRGKTYIHEEPGLERGVAVAVQKGLLSATLNTTEAVQQADVVVVIVPVIIDEYHKVDFKAIDSATMAIGAGLRPGTLVIYETTLPIGTTATRFGSHLERTANLQVGHDFYLAYSPERVKSGHIFRDLCTYPKVIGGVDQHSTDAAVKFYRSVLNVEVIIMASTDEAEFVKLIETAYRDVNIALANEFACFADAHRLDVAAAITAANTQPESSIHTPGVGVGGHCIPVYPYFLLSTVGATDHQTYNGQSPMLVLSRTARHINDSMAKYAVRRIEAEIGSLAGQPILILGVAYRGNVHETAFTCARLLRDAFLEKNAVVYIDDPLFTEDELHALGYTPLPPELKDEVRAIILQADHQAYQQLDLRCFVHCRVVLDGRKALSQEMVESLGMRYIAIGDGNYCSSLKKQKQDLGTLV